MNYLTFFMWKPDFFTFRILGFGLFACHKQRFPILSLEKLWMIPLPFGWHFCLVAPWL